MRYEVYTDDKQIHGFGVAVCPDVAKVATWVLHNPFTFGERQAFLTVPNNEEFPLAIRIEGPATFEEYRAAAQFALDAVNAEYKRLGPFARDLERVLTLGLVSLTKPKE